MRFRLVFLVLGLFVSTGAAQAQTYGQYYKWEIDPFIGYEVGGSYPVNSSTQTAVDKVRVNNSMSFGTFIDRSFTENFQFEFMWNANRTQTAEHDTISGQYDYHNITFRAGINNLTDQGPSYGTLNYGDIIGRTFFVGASAKF